MDLPDILESCRTVIREARHLKIDEGAVAQRARCIDPARLPIPDPPELLRFQGARDACANFTLLCDCLNFCFWSDRPWIVSYGGREWTRTFAMLAGIHRAISEDVTWLEAERWHQADEADLRHIFRGQGEIPLVAERVRVLNETGDGLLKLHDGRFANLVECSGRDASAVVKRLADDFPSFRDVAEYRGRQVAFLKRAQICTADLATLWSSQAHSSPRTLAVSPSPPLPLSPSAVSGLDRLTVFADYRLPQLFRHWGLLRLAAELDARIEARDAIAAGSEEEIEIRASTVVIGDMLSKATGAPAWRLDYFLWEASHAPEVAIEHHRTPTIFY